MITDIHTFKGLPHSVGGYIDTLVVDNNDFVRTVKLQKIVVDLGGKYYHVLLSPPLEYPHYYIDISDVYTANDNTITPVITSQFHTPFKDSLNSFEKSIYTSYISTNLKPHFSHYRVPNTCYIFGNLEFINAFNAL